MAINQAKFQALEARVKKLRAMKAQVQALKDRQAILDVIARHARTWDRHEFDSWVGDVWHPDAIDDHGNADATGQPQVFTPQALVDIFVPRYAGGTLFHMHFLGNHLCDLQGDVAHTETYFITYSTSEGWPDVRSAHARYIHRLERRDGVWKIALQRLIADFRSTLPLSAVPKPAGKWDRTDLTYMRPLTLPPERAALIAK